MKLWAEINLYALCCFHRCSLQELERKLRQESSLQLWPDVIWLHRGLLTLLPALQWLWFFFISPH